MKKTILSLALLAASALSVHAGGILDDLKYDLRAGYNIGGTMPMGMPASIRSLIFSNTIDYFVSNTKLLLH